MSLNSLLDQTLAASSERFPPEAVEIMRAADAQIRADEVGRHALKPGDRLPDATLMSATGDRVSLAALNAEGPLIVTFYRGGWCPYCNLELRAYQDKLDQIKSLGGNLVAISPEKPDGALSTSEKNQLEFPVLTDLANRFAVLMGIAYELPVALQNLFSSFGMSLPELNAETGWALPIPATFVVNSNGKIVLADVDPNYTRRLEPDDALAALRACA